MSIWSDLWPGFKDASWKPTTLAKRLFGSEANDLQTLCRMMMKSDGEFSSLVIAEQILGIYTELDADSRIEFFTMLSRDYDLDPLKIATLAEQYASQPSADVFRALTRAAEPPRQELLRRLNLISGGTRYLVKMREHLLEAVRDHAELERLDVDFRHLFISWFNRGFLVLRPVSWSTSAHILEKIIVYEAVHEIGNWKELRRRLEPADRYCYAFFHPAMEDEPLVFVEVALTAEMPASIDEILDSNRKIITPDEATHAVFYSISNCHIGLRGISFGNFLIKQVVTSLQARFPSLRSFATLSPVPGFRRWLERHPSYSALISSTVTPIPPEELLPVAAQYFLKAKLPNGKPLDYVARFHLKNGARLERINAGADSSPKGWSQSLGLMVNYIYKLNRVEENHENYMQNQEVSCSKQVRKLLSASTL